MVLIADPFSVLSVAQKAALSRAGITSQTGLLVLTPQELCKKLKSTPVETNALLDGFVAELAPKTFIPLPQVARSTSSRITGGDAFLDGMLGGGIRPGVVTELVGESASGKTQFALQLSLLVQLPLEKGGLSGSACYLTTNGALQTSRLVEIAQEHSLMTPEVCKLDDIHTRATFSVPELKHTLSQGIPDLVRHIEKSSAKPLSLLVLDSMGALFRSDTKTSSKTLFERSRELTEIALMLHHLANTWHLAVVVVNEVNSIFERPVCDVSQDTDSNDLLYSEQARWFSRGHSVAAEGYKEAGLGLAWANQVSLRIMMTRTGRRKYLDLSGGRDAKRRDRETEIGDSNRQQSSGGEDALLIRRLSVVFSSFSEPGSIDFVISRSGLVSLGEGLEM